MTTFTGTDINIQRKVRRAWNYLETTAPNSFKAVPGTFLADLLKAIMIAIDEDTEDLLAADTMTGDIVVDVTTESLLNPVPYDKEI